MLTPSLKDLEHNLTTMGDECNCLVIWVIFSTALLGNWDEDWPFSVLWPLLGFQICWHMECSTLRASSFRMLNSSAGIPSHPLALLAAVLLKVHLTSCCRMSGSGWVTTPSWLSGSLKSFLYSSVYSYYLFLISSASFRSLPFLSFIVPIFRWNIPLILPVFLKRSLVFPLLLFSSISLHCSLKKGFCLCYSVELCIQLGVPFSFPLAFHFSSFFSYL